MAAPSLSFVSCLPVTSQTARPVGPTVPHRDYQELVSIVSLPEHNAHHTGKKPIGQYVRTRNFSSDFFRTSQWSLFAKRGVRNSIRLCQTSRDRPHEIVAEVETTQAPGGLDPTTFDVHEAWFPVFFTRDLDKTRPTPFTLLGTPIVIWWDAKADTWRVFADRCPHRLVPLSEGRLAQNGTVLECPYHGWQFDGTGACVRIPQQRADQAAERSRRACAQAFPAKPVQGMLFVYPGTPALADITPVPVPDPLLEPSRSWVETDAFRDVPYDAFTLLENVLDSSHLPFTHHATVGNRSSAAPVEIELVREGRSGFDAAWVEGPRNGTLGPQTTHFKAPSLIWHDLRWLGKNASRTVDDIFRADTPGTRRTLTVVYATPIRKGKCRLFARFPFDLGGSGNKNKSSLPALLFRLFPQWLSHISQNRVLEDDQIFLHHQERALADALAAAAAPNKDSLSGDGRFLYGNSPEVGSPGPENARTVGHDAAPSEPLADNGIAVTGQSVGLAAGPPPTVGLLDSTDVARIFYLPTRADLCVYALHQWLRRYHMEAFPGQRSFPPARPAKELLDRFESHTAHCSSCRRALRAVELSRTGLLAAGLILAVAPGPARVAPPRLAGLAAVSLLWLALGRLEREFRTGDRVPPRNIEAKWLGLF